MDLANMIRNVIPVMAEDILITIATPVKDQGN